MARIGKSSKTGRVMKYEFHIPDKYIDEFLSKALPPNDDADPKHRERLQERVKARLRVQSQDGGSDIQDNVNSHSQMPHGGKHNAHIAGSHGANTGVQSDPIMNALTQASEDNLDVCTQLRTLGSSSEQASTTQVEEKATSPCGEIQSSGETEHVDESKSPILPTAPREPSPISQAQEVGTEQSVDADELYALHVNGAQLPSDAESDGWEPHDSLLRGDGEVVSESEVPRMEHEGEIYMSGALHPAIDDSTPLELPEEDAVVCRSDLGSLIQHQPLAILSRADIRNFGVFRAAEQINRLPANFFTTAFGVARAMDEMHRLRDGRASGIDNGGSGNGGSGNGGSGNGGSGNGGSGNGGGADDRGDDAAAAAFIYALTRRAGYVPSHLLGSDVIYPEDLVPFDNVAWPGYDGSYWSYVFSKGQSNWGNMAHGRELPGSRARR